MTPDVLQHLIDPWWVAIGLAWGVACKYWKPLANIPNESIGWVNFLGYIVAHLSAVTPANAAGFNPAVIPNVISAIIPGFTNAGWAMVVYETLGRTLLEKVFKWEKVTPTVKAA